MVCITIEEALARLSCNDPVGTKFEKVPNVGVTWCSDMPRADALQLLRKHPHIQESGIFGQGHDYGIHLNVVSKQHGPGILFFQTNPNCRLNEQQLKESLERGHGTDIFSGQREHK